ncbi:MAG: TonB-dependent receptor, partial [Sphingomonas sp.]
TVPVTNPYYVDPIGTHLPVGVNYAFGRDLGNETGRGLASGYAATAGIESKQGPWVIDFHGNWGRQFERDDVVNRVNSARLAVALADTNPATAYNLFGDGPSTNPATIDTIRGSTSDSSGAISWATTLRADGPLFRLPAGDLRLAVGGEYRFESFVDYGGTVDVSTLTPQPYPAVPFHAPRRVKAAYAEVLVPVFGGDATIPGFYRLDLSAAVRTERYSDFGTTTNPKLGLAWQPFKSLTLRGTFGKSFRAPSFSELRQDPGSSLIFSYIIPDPTAPSGQANVIVIRGNDPDLRPERSTSWTLGGDFKPLFLQGFHAGITYFNINYRDRIASPSTQLFNFLVNRPLYVGITEANPSAARVAGLYASPIFVNPFNIPQTANFAAVVDARLQNLSVVKESGLDLDIGYGFKVGAGRAEIGATGTYIFSISQALTATAPATDVVGILGNPVDFKARGRLAWNGSRLGAVLFANYVDGYTNQTNAAPQHINAWTTFDLQLSYRFDDTGGPLKGLKVALNATNLFDRDPPYAAYYIGVDTSAYDPENASPLKRVVSFQITKSW